VEFSVLPAWFQADYPWNFNEEDAAASWPVEKRWLVSLKKITQADVLKILEGLRLNKQLHKLTLDYMNIREAFSETIVDLGKMDELLANVPDVIREALMMHEEFAQPLKQYIIALAGIKMQTTGADLKQLGIKEGPQIGQALKLLRTQWLKGTIKTDREEKEYVKKHLGKG
jgi:tRNA nucleotidyltransferase/poly(A) polymerase